MKIDDKHLRIVRRISRRMTTHVRQSSQSQTKKEVTGSGTLAESQYGACDSMGMQESYAVTEKAITKRGMKKPWSFTPQEWHLEVLKQQSVSKFCGLGAASMIDEQTRQEIMEATCARKLIAWSRVMAAWMRPHQLKRHIRRGIAGLEMNWTSVWL